ncbi:MAG TPA: ice-binding family protein [Ignavibacteriaceae bacterium]|nr:ice-binding family protein [Ignavibacteriaceae bacterium]
MKTITTNQRVVSRRCKNLLRNQAVALMTKKFFVIRFLTMLMIALFISGITYSQQLPVNLGTSGNYAILAKSGISTVPSSAIVGDMGVSPIDQTAITGFSLILDPSGVFATSTQVTGKVYAADFADPTPVNLTTAVGDMETAYANAAGRTNPDFTELGAGEIGGLTLVPGLYKWGTDVLITDDVTLNGNSNDVWIFQIAGGIIMASNKSVILTGGAQSKNIFWQSFGSVAIGTTAHFEGIILAQTSISLGTGASMNGILLAQTAVTLDANAVTKPAGTTGVETEFTPQEFFLSQNYPNPFNPSTTVEYFIPSDGFVSLKIFNTIGQEVSTLVNENQSAGKYTVNFNSADIGLPSGLYYYSLRSGEFNATRKMILIK